MILSYSVRTDFGSVNSLKNLGGSKVSGLIKVDIKIGVFAWLILMKGLSGDVEDWVMIRFGVDVSSWRSRRWDICGRIMSKSCWWNNVELESRQWSKNREVNSARLSSSLRASLSSWSTRLSSTLPSPLPVSLMWNTLSYAWYSPGTSPPNEEVNCGWFLARIAIRTEVSNAGRMISHYPSRFVLRWKMYVEEDGRGEARI